MSKYFQCETCKKIFITKTDDVLTCDHNNPSLFPPEKSIKEVVEIGV